MVLAQKERIYYGSHENFYFLIFDMYSRTTLMYIQFDTCIQFNTCILISMHVFNSMHVQWGGP